MGVLEKSSELALNGFEEWMASETMFKTMPFGIKILLVGIASVEIQIDVQCTMLFYRASLLAKFSQWWDKDL